MMSAQPIIHHHPSPEQLMAYTAGTLPLSRALCIATHLDSCTHCQQLRAKLQAVASTQLEELPQQQVSNTVKNRVLQRIHLSQQTPDEQKTATNDERLNEIPRPLHKLIPEGYEKLAWKNVTADVALCELTKEANGTQIALVKVKPGGNMAHHSHTSDEITVILKGSFSDEEGIYHQGDYLFRNSDHKHKPIATNDQSCICLIVLDGPIQLTGFFSSILNPILRLHYQMR